MKDETIALVTNVLVILYLCAGAMILAGHMAESDGGSQTAHPSHTFNPLRLVSESDLP